MKFNLKTFPHQRQLDSRDCGPACLKNVSKHYGKYYSLQSLRDKCCLSREGISFLNLSYAAENIGLKTLSLKTNLNELYNKVPLPVIIHWNNSHFVVVYKITKSQVYVSDPAKGLISYSIKQFTSGWYKKDEKIGYVLVLEPMMDFLQRENNEKVERHKTFQNILSYFRPYKKAIFNLCFVMLIVVSLEACLPFIAKSIIDVGIQTHDLTFINLILIANIVILMSITAANAIRDWTLMHISARINIALISDYLIKLMRLPVTFFENKLTGDILQRANDLERIRGFVMENSLSLIFSSFTFIIFSVILLIFNDTIFYAFVTGSLIYAIWILCFLKFRKKLDWDYFSLISKNQSYWVEIISSIQDIKINNYEKSKRWKWEAIQARLYKVMRRGQIVNNVQTSGGQFIDGTKNLLITYLSAKAVISGEITFGVMISTQFIIGMLNGPVQQFLHFIISAQSAKISFLRVNEIHQLHDEDEHMGTNDISMPADKSLRLKDVGFQYNVHSAPVLRNINLHIPAGKVTALVGDSGSGKTTLLKLLLRLYNPVVGEVLIGNMNINNISLKQWRDKCGAVMQDGKIFNDTILTNVALDEDNVDLQRLKNAVETANIHSEIEKLPRGYQTMMGEQGRGLSGGQKQRILIARALYKDPDYLFFDEATNSLDVVNEQKIVNSLNSVFKGKTVIVVAHRLSTIRNADQIVVLKAGRVVEVGNHASLMEIQNGEYSNLIRVQMEGNLVGVN